MTEQLTLARLEDAAAAVHAVLPPTPQHCWPLLSARLGCEAWVKHENHLPIGAFKVRGGVVYMSELRQQRPGLPGVVAATRGNHGQSIAFAGRRLGIPVTIVVPHGNSVEKNAAMRGFGATLVEAGHDFTAAFEHATALATERRLVMVPSFDFALVRGVASYALELFRGAPPLDAVYVPIGLGSGICGVIAARDALGLRTEVVGVVAERAPAYGLSFVAGRPVATNSADTMADGVAVRVPDAAALAMIMKGAARVVAVSEDAIEAAIRHYFTDTHNLAEGAGAAPLAAALAERERLAGRRVGLILSGGNIDRSVFARVIGQA